jgi:hypothetical protein
MPRTAESRKATRYHLTSPATIRWLGADKNTHEAFGIVRNMSIGGLFVETAAQLRLGANVEVEITPRGVRPNMWGPDLRFEGRVVRIQSQVDTPGFAIVGFMSI